MNPEMYNLNFNLFPTLIIAILLTLTGYFAKNRIKHKTGHKIFLILSFVFTLPAFFFVIYYAHFFDNWLFYIQLRSTSDIEILTGLIGFSIGYFMAGRLSSAQLTLIISCFITLLVVIIPFIKPIILPIQTEIVDIRTEQVCIQSSGSTCGPAALATILWSFGIEKTEKEIARQSYSCSSGTEIWYLIRYAKNLGINTKILKIKSLKDIPVSSIIGTKLRRSTGHFVSIIGRENNFFLIADPLDGLSKLTEEDFHKRYNLHDVCYSFSKQNSITNKNKNGE